MQVRLELRVGDLLVLLVVDQLLAKLFNHLLFTFYLKVGLVDLVNMFLDRLILGSQLFLNLLHLPLELSKLIFLLRFEALLVPLDLIIHISNFLVQLVHLGLGLLYLLLLSLSICLLLLELEPHLLTV